MADIKVSEGVGFYTRGGPDVPDARGRSMVAKHAEAMQNEKESRAMAKLAALVPHLSAATQAVALQESDWNDERALAMLRQFISAYPDELRKLRKERERHLESISKPEASSSDEQSSSGNETERDEEHRRKHRRRKRSRSPKRSRRRDEKERRSKKRRAKEEKRTKERKEKHDRDNRKERDRGRRRDSKAKPEVEYGKYGVIRETDYYTKRPEFTLWALEVKGADLEAVSRYEEKELFRTYMEDYNTATLPHRKYYDLEAYERQRTARMGGTSLDLSGERMMFDDEAERRREMAEERQRQQTERLKAAYEELQTTDKAAAMREQEMLRAKMALAYRTGNQREAQRLAERLRPDDQKTQLPPRESAPGT